MEELEVEIGDLFSFCTKKYGIKFLENELVNVPFELWVPGEKNNKVRISAMIKKRAILHSIKFSNHEVKGADNHLLSYVPHYNLNKLLSDVQPGDEVMRKQGDGYVLETVISNEKLEEDDVYGLKVESPLHLYSTADGFVHHNTYTVKKAVEKGIQRNPKGWKYVILSGDVGASPSSVLFILWKYRDGYVVILDDCDSMIKSKSQTVANILKGALDPDIKPLAAGSFEVRKLVQKQIDADKELNPSGIPKKEQIKRANAAKLDAEKLKKEAEKRLADIVKDEENEEKMRVIIDKERGRMDSEEVKKFNTSPKGSVGKLKWRFKNGKMVLEEKAELTPEELATLDEPELTSEQVEEMQQFDIPTEFTFSSSVIFISNLDFMDVNSAVRDRCLPADIKLTREEFMVRLELVLGGLCKENPSLNTIPQTTLDWAKRNAYSMLRSMIQAEKEKRPLFADKRTISINRQLTFRSIDDLVAIFLNVNKVLENSDQEFKALTDLDQRAKRMTYQFARETAEYLAIKSSA
jgi:hypothetical protein